MENSNKHIEDFLNEFLQIEKPGFAVLIKGAWGSGKTYFVKNYIEHQLKPNNKELKPIYISLFGVSSKEEIDSRIYEAVHNLINKPVSKLAFGVAKTATLIGCNILGGAAAQEATSRIIGESKKIGKFLKECKDNYVLFFDDCERASVDLVELFGFINPFVEDDGLHCILVADEDAWIDQFKHQSVVQKNVYEIKPSRRKSHMERHLKYEIEEINEREKIRSLKLIKEKVIGKEFTVKSNPESVIDQWLDASKGIVQINERTKKILRKNKVLLTRIISFSGVSNYRAIRYSLLDFDLFIGGREGKFNIPDNLLRKSKFNELLIADFFCIHYSFYLGNLINTDIGQETPDDVRVEAYMNEDAVVEIPATAWEKHSEQYSIIPRLSVNTGSYGKKWFNVWKDWLTKSQYDIEYVKKLISESEWFDKSKNPDLQNIYRWPFLSAKEGDSAISAFYKALMQKTLLNSNEIFSLFYHLYWYAQKGALYETADKLYERMSKYIKSIKGTLVYERLDEPEEILQYHSLYREYKNRNEEFRHLIESELVTVKQKKKLETFELFYKKLTCKDVKTLLSACTMVSEQYGKSEFFSFQKIDPERFIKIFISHDPESQDRIRNAIEKRYDRVKIDDEEKKFLERMRAAIDLKFKEKPKEGKYAITTSQFGLYYLGNQIKKILEN
jgi:peroxiredoxin family protein